MVGNSIWKLIVDAEGLSFGTTKLSTDRLPRDTLSGVTSTWATAGVVLLNPTTSATVIELTINRRLAARTLTSQQSLAIQ